MDRVEAADAIGFRRKKRGPGDEDRRETDQRMEGRDELRHLRHGDAARDDGADATTDDEAHDDEPPGERVLRLQHRERRHDGNRHADHAVGVALARRLGRRQAAKRENEKHRRSEVQQGRYIG